jgi:hypothetical protein
MFTWDGTPHFYFTSKMRSPSRYLSADYIRDSPVTMEKIRDRIFNDLEHKPPSFLVDKTENPTVRVTDDTAYRWFHRFIEQNYRLAFSENRLSIYVLDRARSPISKQHVQGEGAQSWRPNGAGHGTRITDDAPETMSHN